MSSQTSSAQSQFELRKQRTREFRKEHFVFGFDKSGMGESQSQQTYKEHNLDGTSEIKKEMQEQKGNLRASHFTLGTENPKKLYSTTSGDAYIEQHGGGRGKLSEETKNDLRSHHFVFGNDPSNKQSVYKSNYISKEIDANAAQNRKDMVVTLRKHDFEFGDDKNYYSSMYNQNHVNSYDPSFLKQGKSKDEIMNQIVQLRQTNLNLGDVRPDYQSQAMTQFNDQGYAQIGYQDMGLKNSNIVFGNDNIQYSSYAKQCYNQEFKPADIGVNQALAQDLRKEHFKFGEDKPMYQSQAKRNFIDFAKESLNQKELDGDFKKLQKNHFDLGNNNAAIGGTNQDRFKSHYNNQHNNTNHENFKQNDTTSYQQNNIVLGSEENQNRFVSQASGNYVGNSGPSAKLSVDQQNDLRSTHYNLGTDDISKEQSHYKDTHNNQSQNFVGSQLQESLKKDLRSHHFVYGFQKPEMESVGSDIGQYQGPPTKLDPELAKDLRSHHWG